MKELPNQYIAFLDPDSVLNLPVHKRPRGDAARKRFPFGISLISHEVRPLETNEPDKTKTGFSTNSWHSSILIVPRDQNRWKRDPRFKKNSDGLVYLTLGAGPSLAVLCGAHVKPDNNRTSDDPMHHYNDVVYTYPTPAKAPEPSDDFLITWENHYIEKLLAGIDHYRKVQEQYEYDLFPQRDKTKGHNSNSFVAGLLGYAKLRVPELKNQHPGLDKPIPLKAFE